MFSKCAGEAESREATGAGRVSSWSLGLRQLLSDAAGYAYFAAFLDKERSKENIDFWWECERYRKESSARLAQQIWSRFLHERAPEPVNVDARVRQITQQRLPDAPPDLFEKAQEQIFRLMEFDSYRRFLKSQEHSECARAELQGQPLPGAAHMTTKLKKSRSNAEERGRGVFSFRFGARDRPLSNHNRTTPDDCESPRRPSLSLDRLCRVMLPDAATSVQQVVDSLTIRECIDNMLRNRGIKCRLYEVIVKGNHKPENLDGPMSALAGREVVVERRVSLRLTFADRRALLACSRPDKTLSDVVHSALRYYRAPHAGDIRVARGSQLVPLDTPVEKLDNERLLVHIIPEAQAKGATDESCATSAGRLPSVSFSPTLTHQGRPGCPSLDEITNRVFEEVLPGKTPLAPSTENSTKSESCGCQAAGGAVLARLRPGDPVLTASPTPAPTTEMAQNVEETAQRRLSKPPSPAAVPVPAARSFTRPRPAVRTSLAKSSPPSERRDACADSPGLIEPPPLPPKPRVVPAKPSNWGQNADINRICAERPTTSFV